MIINAEKIFKEKKAQIGTTLTWIPAIAIIFFVMIVFVVAAGMVAVKDISENTGGLGAELELSNVEGMEIKEGIKSPYLQRQLVVFLNSPLEHNEKRIKIKEIIRKEDIGEDEKELIKEYFNDFFNKKRNPSLYDYYSGFTFKFYSINEPEGFYVSEGDVSKRYSSKGGDNPASEGCINFFISKNKEVSLCGVRNNEQ